MTKRKESPRLKEKGEVISVTNNMVKVAIPREAKCGGCKHCVSAGNGKYMLAEAYNTREAKIGDSVIIESGNINQVSDGFLLFIVPLLMIILGFAAAEITGSPLAGLLTAVVLLAGLFTYFRLSKDKYQMQVTDIIEPVTAKEQ